MSDPEDIRGWQRLGPETTTSGRLLADDVARLEAVGVRHVVNLALADHAEALADEAELLAAAGIAYSHIPVPFDAPGEEHYAAFVAALDQPGPVHVHCVMNWRVSAFFYRYHRDVTGMPEPAARGVMQRQWSPEASDHPTAKVWAAFIAPRA
jgi:protein tyrosine phosphatase (PTP) superfamily phosphohydrolase (DUF442 family)